MRSVVVVGMPKTHVCVFQTARELVKRGYPSVRRRGRRRVAKEGGIVKLGLELCARGRRVRDARRRP